MRFAEAVGTSREIGRAVGGQLGDILARAHDVFMESVEREPGWEKLRRELPAYIEPTRRVLPDVVEELE